MQKTIYRGDDGGRGPSPNIWYDARILDMLLDPSKGFVFFDDFLSAPTFATTVVQQGWYPYLDTSCTAKMLTTEVGGVLQLLTVNTQDKELAIISGSAIAGMGKIANNSGKKLWFETRVRFSTIASQSCFIGLTEEQVPADSMLADGGTGLASKDKVGFQVLEADPDGLDAIYNDTTGDTVVKDVAQELVAATWYKIGFRFDGDDTVKYFVDNVQVGSNVDLDDASAFPDGEELAVAFALKTHDGTARALDIDWVRVAGEY